MAGNWLRERVCTEEIHLQGADLWNQGKVTQVCDLFSLSSLFWSLYILSLLISAQNMGSISEDALWWINVTSADEK